MNKAESTLLNVPKAKKIAQRLTTHQHSRIDNYYWMNDRSNPEVIQYLNEENQYLEDQLSDTVELQEQLFQEMKGRIKEVDESVPYLKDGFYYYTKYVKGGEYPVFCRKKETLEAPEEVILDQNVLAEDFDYFNVSALGVAPDHNLLAFAQDIIGRRIYSLRFKNLLTGEFLEDEIVEVTGNFVWANDNHTLFYSKQDQDTLRSYQIYKHILGTP
jgi:oligopeptidase B